MIFFSSLSTKFISKQQKIKRSSANFSVISPENSPMILKILPTIFQVILLPKLGGLFRGLF